MFLVPCVLDGTFDTFVDSGPPLSLKPSDPVGASLSYGMLDKSDDGDGFGTSLRSRCPPFLGGGGWVELVSVRLPRRGVGRSSLSDV